MSIQQFLAKRIPSAAMSGLLALTGGLSAPVPVQTSLSVMAVVMVGSAFVPASAATAPTPVGTVELSPAPPNVTKSVAPNIVLTFDDSGSMAQTNIPDSLPISKKYYYSANSNPVYYNPATTYEPPLKPDGVTRFPASTYTNAWKDGLCTNSGGTGTRYNGTSISCLGTTDLSTGYRTKAVFSGSTSSPPQVFESGMQNIPNSIGSAGGFYYDCPTVNSETGCKLVLVGSTDDTTPGTVADQQQNFANWYSYYRTRIELTRSAMAETFAQLSKNMRVAYQFLNAGSLVSGGTTTYDSFADTSPGVGPRSDFFKWLYGAYANNSTPTPAALYAVGQALKYGKGVKSDKNPYWEEGAGVDGKGMELTCRQNFSVLVTDGYWNKAITKTIQKTSAGATLPDGTTYDPAAANTNTRIYSNVPATSYSSLSDLAFNYWATNLRPDFTDPADPSKPKLDVPTSISDYTDVNGNPVTWDGKGLPPPAIYFNPKNDPASWPHLVQYMVSLGANGTLAYPGDYDALRQGATAWPTPSSSGDATDIDDTWHAAINSRGAYLEANDPPSLVAKLNTILTSISALSAAPKTGSLNTSVLTQGALAFQSSYNSADWSGTLKAFTANIDGSISGSPVWDGGDLLTKRTSPPRTILTATENSDGSFNAGTTFAWSNLDAAGQTLIAASPASSGPTDTGAARVDWLNGVTTNDGTLYRKRTTLLGAIIGSQAVYVSYPSSGYRNSWPAGSPEALAMAADTSCIPTAPTLATCHSYEAFASVYQNRMPAVYVGANDGMMHAFDASMMPDPTDPAKAIKTSTSGDELFAYVPRSAYPNLGNVTNKDASKFRPTVDGIPVTRDVFFGGAWHTVLVGGLRLGGRGVYALDVTDPTAMSASKVLWEFNADAPATASPGCVATSGSCDPADLGYTFGQPNIGRLHNGKWVVLVPGGYFPDCSKPPYTVATCPTPGGSPTSGTPAVAFSSLFVLDAQTGKMIAELKTPTDITGVSSFGLSTPVLGDYNNDQVDDVAFAGDLQGNLWRFDLSSSTPSSWNVSLSYQPSTAGLQPITSMPRLFPDPATNRFIVVFGTGKYLGASDATDGTMQSIYGIRDNFDSATGKAITASKTNLQKQTLYEAASANKTNIVRGLTDNIVSSTKDGWYIDLDLTTSPGERVVVTPEALPNTNRVIITTLIPGTQDPCSTTVNGALMVFNAATGGAGGGLSGPDAPTGGWTTGVSTVGGRVTNPPTGGSVPVASVIGGGKLLLPGLELQGGGNLNIDDAIWRRRAWRELNNDQ